MATNEQRRDLVVAFNEAQKAVIHIQAMLVRINSLATQIPMHQELGKMVGKLKEMSVDVVKLPL